MKKPKGEREDIEKAHTIYVSADDNEAMVEVQFLDDDGLIFANIYLAPADADMIGVAMHRSASRAVGHPWMIN